MSSGDGFRGVIAPVLTPFGEDGRADAERLVEHAKWLLDEGCTALAPFGTTSEANSLSLDERRSLLEALIDGGIDPARLMPGTGMCSAGDTINLTRHAIEAGCGAVLMLPPFYYKGVSDDGLFAHFASVIDGVGDDRLAVFLYHIPPVAQVGFSLDLIARLREAFPNQVVGLKDSSGEWSNTKSIIEAFPGFCVFSGSEATLLDNLRAGGAGCISATANVNARGLRAVFDAWQSEGADDLQTGATALRLAIQKYPVIPLLKAIISAQRRDGQWAATRAPLWPLDRQVAFEAMDLLEREHGFGIGHRRAA